MSRPEKRAKSRWRARYYGPDGKQRSKTFKSEREAQLFLASQEVSKARGEWTDPALGKTTVGEWAERWFATTAALKPKTRADYRSLLDTHVLPTFGNVPLAHLEPIAVREWVARLRLSPSRTRRAYIVLALVCKSAVESGRIATSPCVGVRLPRVQAAEQIIITEDQVSALADVCIGYSELVHVLAYGGLRWAEAVGLRKGRVDPLRSRVHVVETLSEVAGKLYTVPPKSYARRYVKLPRFVTETLGRLCAGDPDELVFRAPRGGALRDSHFRLRVWLPALRALDGAVPGT